MALAVGSRLGHYDVTALIGEGGMGQVYQATDTKLNRQVALKIPPEAFAADPDRLARFQREAQVLASLNHPNIAAIYGLEETDPSTLRAGSASTASDVEGSTGSEQAPSTRSGQAPSTSSGQATRALVLELVEGPTLADRIAQGPIPIDEALPIAKQIAEALEAAHEAGIIHRDLKPANIKVREDGTVKVLDFGLAKALDPSPDADPSQSPTLTAAATQMGVIMGTAAYMSPEQAAGQPADKRSDIWSFGVVLHEMLTGQGLFTGKTISHVLAKVLEREIDFTALPTTTPAALLRLLRRCLDKDQKHRLRDAAEAVVHLEEAATSPLPETPPVPAPTTTSRRSAVVWAVVGVLVGGLVIGGAVWYLRPSPLPGSPERFVLSASPSAVPGLQSSQTALAISPDGSRIVYRTVGGGASGIYVRRVDRLEGELLPGVEQAASFFFSPNGQWVGFSTGVDDTLKKVQVNGGAAITLCPMPGSPRGASWGPDETIIFAHFGGNGLFRVSAALECERNLVGN